MLLYRYKQIENSLIAAPSYAFLPDTTREQGMRTRSSFLWTLGFAAALATAGNGATPTFPSRPITIIVPFAAGGQSDILIRILAEHMRASFGEPVIIENVGGAAARIGTA